MRRMFWVLLVVLLLCSGAFAQDGLKALDLAVSLSGAIDSMTDVRDAPLDGQESNRAIWTDKRTDGKCTLVVYENADVAAGMAVSEGTSYTSMRAVDCCLLGIDADLSVSLIDEYETALADILNVKIDDEAPDYILNVNTKKFHYPACSSVDEMKESNKMAYSGDRDDLLSQGYKACKRCNP